VKLFQKLLIAPAALGLFAPISAEASDLVNLEEMNSYVRSQSKKSSRFDSRTFFNGVSEDISKLKEGVDGLEAKQNEFEAGSFSETTTMSGSASFQVGGVQNSVITESVTATYSYDLDLNTSFTGDDNLYVGLETGNSSALNDFTLDSSGDGADALSVTSMYYQFPVGEFNVAVGPKLDTDDLMPTTTSKYSDTFFFGGSWGLGSDYFVSQGTGAGFAIAREFDNGMNASFNIVGTGANTQGLLTEDGNDIYTASFGYDAENYGGGLIYQKADSVCSLADDWTTVCTDYSITTALDKGYSATSIGGYYTPNDKTTISLTSTITDASVKGASVDSIQDFQLAVDRELGNGVLSASWKTFPFFKVPDLNGTEIKSDELGSVMELYYTYNVNDSLTITPGIYFTMREQDADDIAAGTDDLAFYLYDRTALGLGATFKF